MRKRIRLHYARDSRSELIREISVFLATRDTSTRWRCNEDAAD